VSPESRHLLIELHGAAVERLDDLEGVRQAMLEAARAAGATVVAEVFHRYAPQGVSGVVVIEESHLGVHTWPEARYAAIDFYTCGKVDPFVAAERLGTWFCAERIDTLLIERGLDRSPSLRVAP
jgi:S-adenosylmethionine decarboxylase proenzyme